jgi:hypothetical protein
VPTNSRSSTNSTRARRSASPATINCRFYLIGNAVIVNGLFEYGAMAGLGAPVRVCISQNEGEDVRIDVDEPTAFFSQFSEFAESKVPAILDKDLINHLVAFAS